MGLLGGLLGPLISYYKVLVHANVLETLLTGNPCVLFLTIRAR